MQWFLYGRRWILFYSILLLIVGLLSYLTLQLGYIFLYKEIYITFFIIVMLTNFIPTLLFSLAGIVVKKPAIHPHITPKKIPFLVIIPAYNEKEVILNSVQSLVKQKTGDIYTARVIVAFNGTDNTGDIASRHGAEVFTTPVPQCGKSKAIEYVFSAIDYDRENIGYVIIIDADNVVEDDYLYQVALACQSQKVAYQSNHQPLLVSKNWISKGLNAGYCASSRLFNIGRSNLLNSALLCGTGMVLRDDVVRDLWRKVKTQTEDIEMNGLLSLYYNSGVEWIPTATFYDEKPDVIDVAIRQRVRWMVGHTRCFYYYSIPLLKQFFTTGSLRALELAIYYLVPISLLVSALWMLLLVPIALVGYSYTFNNYYDDILIVTLIFILYMIVLPALGYFLQKDNLPFWQRLLQAFVYSCYAMVFATLVWPITILFACISLPSKTWIFHTPHKAKVIQ